MSLHPFHVLLKQAEKTPTEQALLAAIMLLSVQQYSACTPEEIYDRLITEYHDLFGNRPVEQPFLHMIYRRMLQMEHNLSHTLNRMEKTQLAQSTALTRLQDDNTKLKQLVTDLQTSVTTMGQAASDAYARFQKSLDDLKAAAGNDDTLNAIAADLESSLATLATVKSATDAAGATAAGEDVDAPPPPPPPPPTEITISGPDSVAAGNTASFSASEAVTWSASIGSIDQSGVYTPPPDATVTSDTITATAADGRTANKGITITQ